MLGVKSFIMNLFTESRRANQDDHHDKGVPKVTSLSWNKPPPNWVKINFDAAIFQDVKCSGLGSMIKDEHGTFLSARSRRMDIMLKTKEAQAMSLKEALVWTKEMGFQRCIFETDSMLLVKACKREHGRSFFHTPVRDCIDYFKHFDQVQVKFVRKSANGIAHLLAKATYSTLDIQEWVNDDPEFILDAMVLDST